MLLCTHVNRSPRFLHFDRFCRHRRCLSIHRCLWFSQRTEALRSSGAQCYQLALPPYLLPLKMLQWSVARIGVATSPLLKPRSRVNHRHVVLPLCFQSLRATKVVRSIHSLNPKRESGSGRIGRLGTGPGGAWGDVNDGVGGRWEETRSRQNRSSIVAHVPAETLCSNPLKPCGACMEWLKKIAEVNPDFKVITFTDSCCGGVYIEDVAQIL